MDNPGDEKRINTFLDETKNEEEIKITFQWKWERRIGELKAAVKERQVKRVSKRINFVNKKKERINLRRNESLI